MTNAEPPNDTVGGIRQQCTGTTFHAGRGKPIGGEHRQSIARDLIEELSQTVRYETPVIMGIDRSEPSRRVSLCNHQSGNQQRLLICWSIVLKKSI